MPKMPSARKADVQPKTVEHDGTPYWTTSDGEFVKLYQGDVLAVLRTLPSGSVQTVVTSPPYWGLRDYGTASWEGGDPNCNHKSKEPRPRLMYDGAGKVGNSCLSKTGRDATTAKETCSQCGARRIDQQIGSEKTPGEFIEKMVEVFREVRRVLRDDGTLWLNLGDTYSNTGACGGASPVGQRGYRETDRIRQESMQRTREGTYGGIKSGNLMMIPHKVAIALQADGWIVRQDIVWHKPSPMPESVRNRCTKAHEYIFLLAKRSGYFYDAEAIKETSIDPESLNGRNLRNDDKFVQTGGDKATYRRGFSQIEEGKIYNTRNKRSVWSVSSQGYEGAHFATFPPKLIEPCILAGTSAYGACAECGAPYRRVVEEKEIHRRKPEGGLPAIHADVLGNGGSANSLRDGHRTLETKTIGWEPTCECNGKFVKSRVNISRSLVLAMPGFSGNARLHGRAKMDQLTPSVETTRVEYIPSIPIEEHPVVPCVVLDIFIGSGTTCCVSISHGRRSIGIDLSEKYLRENAISRIEGELTARPALSHLTGRVRKALKLGRRL